MTLAASVLLTAAVGAQELCPGDDVSAPGDGGPEIIGATWSFARVVLEEEGYELDVRPEGADEEVDALVLSWGIDTPFDDASPETAVVCLGRVVPDVRGRTSVDAQSVVGATGFLLQLSPDDVDDDWTVIRQSPGGGTLTFLGTPVQLLMTPPTVPETTVEPTEPPNTTAITTPPDTATPDTTPDTVPPVTAGPVVSVAPPSSSGPWRPIVGVGAGASAAVAVGGLLAVRSNRRRWRRRITTVTGPAPPLSTVDDGPACVVRVELTPEDTIERLEEGEG